MSLGLNSGLCKIPLLPLVKLPHEDCSLNCRKEWKLLPGLLLPLIAAGLWHLPSEIEAIIISSLPHKKPIRKLLSDGHNQ